MVKKKKIVEKYWFQSIDVKILIDTRAAWNVIIIARSEDFNILSESKVNKGVYIHAQDTLI